jgi:hypothetical protein
MLSVWRFVTSHDDMPICARTQTHQRLTPFQMTSMESRPEQPANIMQHNCQRQNLLSSGWPWLSVRPANKTPSADHY